jgi:phage gpG-like protein
MPAATPGGSAYGFSVTVLPPVAVLRAQFLGAAEDLAEPAEGLRRVVEQVAVPAIGRHFDEEGPGWDPLSDETVIQRGATGPILDRTGQLRAGLTSPDIWTYTENEARLELAAAGGDVYYGQFHAAGTTFMPMRDFLYLSQTDEEMAEEVMADWVSERIADNV